jgi:pyruvate kinase
MISLQALAIELRAIDAELAHLEPASAPFLSTLPASQVPSAVNLLHYLALRRHDLRPAQRTLAAYGLSSLGRTESHTRTGLEAVLRVLHLLAGLEWAPPTDGSRISLEDGDALLAEHTERLLGPCQNDRAVRIMVTMPTEAASDYVLIRDLVAGGMDCMRINCAHDSPETWRQMIAHLRKACAETGRACSVCMDIAGPKLRTAEIEAGPAVKRIKPFRDPWGRVSRSAVVALVSASCADRSTIRADAILVLDRKVPSGLQPNDEIELVDTRDRVRVLRVTAHQDGVALATLDRTAYVTAGTRLTFRQEGQTDTRVVSEMPSLEQALSLRPGDLLVLTPGNILGRPGACDETGRIVIPPHIGVTLPELFTAAQPGESIWFDDGRIGGILRSVEPELALVEITHARPEGEKLRAGKGINLPDTDLKIDALTAKDLEDLDFVVEHADLVGYSFVRRKEDVARLQSELAARGGAHLGILLKIETRRAFEELPRLLLACMRTGRFGVMIARGDLAIECGYERLAEIQEEILWIAEAAHAPVVWATQVLETLAKTGVPSRAEVTDAAMAERAECVMLNKGPFVRLALQTLADILRRMEAHQAKKRAMLRPLKVAHQVLVETLALSDN